MIYSIEMDEKIQLKSGESLLDEIDQESLLKEIEAKPDVQLQSVEHLSFTLIG